MILLIKKMYRYQPDSPPAPKTRTTVVLPSKAVICRDLPSYGDFCQRCTHLCKEGTHDVRACKLSDEPLPVIGGIALVDSIFGENPNTPEYRKGQQVFIYPVGVIASRGLFRPPRCGLLSGFFPKILNKRKK
jgi:hypothetical protein